MKILYVAPKHDYGKQERGLSFEHYNFFDTLLNMGNNIIYFDYLGILRKVGKARMNRLLLDVFRQEKPDIAFVFLMENEIDYQTMSQISKSSNAATVNWFADDHWRFDNFSRYWASNFNWVITTDSEAASKYKSIGYENVILSQWACNHFLYKNLNQDPAYDVSFIGQAYGNRKQIIRSIETAGIKVLTKGYGWAAGRVGQDEMIEIFNKSKINLNLSNASIQYGPAWIQLIDKHALYTPGFKRPWRRVRSILASRSSKARTILQIKGRNFEVPGCGGFLLTDYIEELEQYYSVGQDIVCYNSVDDMIQKIKYFLDHDNLRDAIAKHGWQTTLSRHTYVHRFTSIFQTMGFACKFSLDANPGHSIEVSESI